MKFFFICIAVDIYSDWDGDLKSMSLELEWSVGLLIKHWWWW